MSGTYQLVRFDDKSYGVRVWDEDVKCWYFLHPRYESRFFHKKKVVGFTYRFSMPQHVIEHCFMSKADAEDLFRIVTQEEDMEIILHGKIKNPTVVSAYSG